MSRDPALLELSLDPRLGEALDAWRSRQSDSPSRSEAARRLIEHGLGGSLTHLGSGTPAVDPTAGLRSVGPEDEVRSGPEAPKD